MRALIVYESMFGNTHAIAERIARGLGGAEVVAVADATPEVLTGAGLLVVGGPTHVHGMVTGRTRDAARQQAGEPGSGLTLDPHAEGPTLREWFDALTLEPGRRAAAFDTRVHGPAPLTGRASRGIAKRLEKHGAILVSSPESFFVERDNHLVEGEADRAERWGTSLAVALAAL